MNVFLVSCSVLVLDVVFVCVFFLIFLFIYSTAVWQVVNFGRNDAAAAATARVVVGVLFSGILNVRQLGVLLKLGQNLLPTHMLRIFVRHTHTHTQYIQTHIVYWKIRASNYFRKSLIKQKDNQKNDCCLQNQFRMDLSLCSSFIWIQFACNVTKKNIDIFISSLI